MPASWLRLPSSISISIVSETVTRTPQPNNNEFEKLEQDLATVLEKVKLCREMLLESPGIHEDEALSEVIGFLEACRDRMFDVIEAGSQGLLGEDLFDLCLKVNAAVLKTLEAEKVSADCDLNMPAGLEEALESG